MKKQEEEINSFKLRPNLNCHLTTNQHLIDFFLKIFNECVSLKIV
jgi:hypothetical protein